MKNLLLAMCMLFVPAMMQANDNDEQFTKNCLKPGAVAPNFELQNPYGSKVKLSHLNSEYVVLEFSASWCPDCRRIASKMDSLSWYSMNRHVVFVNISFDENKETWLKYLRTRKHDVSFRGINLSPLKKWKETQVSKDYRVDWIPTMYLINPQGRVELVTTDPEVLHEALEKLPTTPDGKDVERGRRYYYDQLGMVSPCFAGAKNKGNQLGVIKPVYQEGMEGLKDFLADNMKFPKICEQNGIVGKVTMSFMVDVDGSVCNLETEEVTAQKANKDKLSREEAKVYAKAFVDEVKRLMGLCEWKPGELSGAPAKFKFHLPVTFQK